MGCAGEVERALFRERDETHFVGDAPEEVQNQLSWETEAEVARRGKSRGSSDRTGSLRKASHPEKRPRRHTGGFLHTQDAAYRLTWSVVAPKTEGPLSGETSFLKYADNKFEGLRGLKLLREWRVDDRLAMRMTRAYRSSIMMLPP